MLLRLAVQQGLYSHLLNVILRRRRNNGNHGWQLAQGDEQRDSQAEEQMGNIRTPLILSTLTSERTRGNSHPARSDSGSEKQMTSDRTENEASCASLMHVCISKELYIECGKRVGERKREI